MVVIENNFIGAIIAFLLGLAISAVNYAISKYVLKYHTSKYPFLQLIRTSLQVGYLVVLYFCGEFTPWKTVWLLVGGALGITLPMLFFTYRLVKLNDSLKKKDGESDG
ncbi:MAG: hypothetical protein J6B88_03745 [Clostridia bacterium]|nr:hypothetical protein [Clostridia bacterium]